MLVSLSITSTTSICFVSCVLNNSGFGDAGIVHHACSGPQCCPDHTNPAALRNKVAAALQETMLSASPPVPQSGRWTKLGLFLDWAMLALFGGFFPALFRYKAEMFTKGTSGHKIDALDDFLLDVEYREVRGARFKKARSQYTCIACYICISTIMCCLCLYCFIVSCCFYV